MTLENIYYIGQTVAVMALLISLVAIWFQIRQANRLAKLEPTRMIWAEATSMLRSQVGDAEQAEFLQRALFESGEITASEKTRLYIILSSMFVSGENGFAMAQSNMLEESFWPRMRMSMANYLQSARGRHWWSTARARVFKPNAAYVAAIDEIVEEIEAAEQKEQT